MAKKEKSVKDASTVAAKAAEQIGREVLAANKTLNSVYVTTDGTAFAERNDAQNHARTLQNREVFNIGREKVAPESGKEPEPATEVSEPATATDNPETAKDNAETDD